MKSQMPGLFGVFLHKNPVSGPGILKPSCRVEPRYETEGHVPVKGQRPYFGAGPVDPGDLQERRYTRPFRIPQGSKPGDDPMPVQPDNRVPVTGDGQCQKVVCPPLRNVLLDVRFPEKSQSQEVRDTRSGEILQPERSPFRQVGIKYGAGFREAVAGQVVIGDNDVRRQEGRLAAAFKPGYSAVGGDEKTRPTRRKLSHARRVKAVPFFETTREVHRHVFCSGEIESLFDNGCAGYPIGVEVGIDHDWFPAVDGLDQPPDGGSHAGKIGGNKQGR